MNASIQKQEVQQWINRVMRGNAVQGPYRKQRLRRMPSKASRWMRVRFMALVLRAVWRIRLWF